MARTGRDITKPVTLADACRYYKITTLYGFDLYTDATQRELDSTIKACAIKNKRCLLPFYSNLYIETINIDIQQKIGSILDYTILRHVMVLIKRKLELLPKTVEIDETDGIVEIIGIDETEETEETKKNKKIAKSIKLYIELISKKLKLIQQLIENKYSECRRNHYIILKRDLLPN
jgi:hypothetical protein